RQSSRQAARARIRVGGRRRPHDCPRRRPANVGCENARGRIIGRMTRRIAFAALIATACTFASVAAQQPAPAGRGRGAAANTPPPLFFKEAWQITGPAHAIAPGENVLTNANLELKLYG